MSRSQVGPDSDLIGKAAIGKYQGKDYIYGIIHKVAPGGFVYVQTESLGHYRFGPGEWRLDK